MTVRCLHDRIICPVAPAEIVKKCGLADLLGYMEACGAEAVVLGCTHFPYLKDELAKLTDLPLIDPADRMFEALTAKAV